MVRKTFTEEVSIEGTKPDWDLLFHIYQFAQERIPDPKSEYYNGRTSEADVGAATFQELRAELEDEEVWLLRFYLTDKSDFHIGYNLLHPMNQVTVEGEEQDRVVGTAETLRRSIARWQEEGLPDPVSPIVEQPVVDAEPPVVDAEQLVEIDPPPPEPWWKRHLVALVVSVGGSLIAAAILFVACGSTI